MLNALPEDLMKTDLKSLEDCLQIEKNCLQIEEHLSGFIQFHSESKEFSEKFDSKNKILENSHIKNNAEMIFFP